MKINKFLTFDTNSTSDRDIRCAKNENGILFSQLLLVDFWSIKNDFPLFNYVFTPVKFIIITHCRPLPSLGSSGSEGEQEKCKLPRLVATFFMTRYFIDGSGVVEWPFWLHPCIHYCLVIGTAAAWVSLNRHSNYLLVFIFFKKRENLC